MQIPGPEVGYTDLLDLAIHEKCKNEIEDEKKGKFRGSPLRPSSAGYCARRLAYAYHEYKGNAYYDKEPKTPELWRLLELGHAVEFTTLKHFHLLKTFSQKYKQQALSLFEIVSGDDKNFQREIVEGSCDFVLWNEKTRGIGDVKSKKDGWSQGYKSRWEEELDKFAHMGSVTQLSETAFYAPNLDDFIEELGADDFLVDNLYQLNAYANAPFIKHRGIDHGFLYRYNKNDSRHMEIRFNPSEGAARYVQDKFNNVYQSINDHKNPELVEKEHFIGSMRCGFCPYNTQCWGDANALKEYFNTLPKKSWPTDIKEGDWLDKAFKHFAKLLEVEASKEKLELEIVKYMAEKKLKKIRLPDQSIYETKYLKTPHPHVELRRSKL